MQHCTVFTTVCYAVLYWQYVCISNKHILFHHSTNWCCPLFHPSFPSTPLHNVIIHKIHFCVCQVQVYLNIEFIILIVCFMYTNGFSPKTPFTHTTPWPNDALVNRHRCHCHLFNLFQLITMGIRGPFKSALNAKRKLKRPETGAPFKYAGFQFTANIQIFKLT